MKVTYDQLGSGSHDGAIVYVVSDSLGDSALNVVLEAAAQFEEGSVRVVRLAQVDAPECVSAYFDEHADDFVSTAVFHSIVNPQLSQAIKADLNNRGITTVDILGPVIQLLSSLTGQRPKNLASAHHTVDSRYLRRVGAMEFFLNHDDGKNPQDLPSADVVLIGLTGSAKSPLAMRLSFLGYKVASISLDAVDELPQELSQVDPHRVFGLATNSDVLAQSRKRQLAGGTAAAGVPPVDLARIEDEQAAATAAMDRLGCVRIDVEDKTVEELAADILSRIEA